MSHPTEREYVATKRVEYDLPGCDAVVVRRDVEFRGADGGALAMDLYVPPATGSGGVVPAVVIVAGYPDPGLQRILGCRFKDMGACESWGRFIAASGMAAITYTNRDPAADLHALFTHLRQSAAALNIDEHRVGLWASSGNAPLALSLLLVQTREPVACTAICYGYSLDVGGTAVADAARTLRFANPGEGASIDELSADTPLFVVRAGQDATPGLNDALDRFVAAALGRNLPITCVNHPTAPHAFDLFEASDFTREIIGQILAFLRFHLLAAPVTTR